MTRARPGAIRGRPPTLAADARLVVMLPSELLVAVQRAAERERVSVPDWVRGVLGRAT